MSCRYCGCTAENRCEILDAVEGQDGVVPRLCILDPSGPDPTLCSRCALWPVGFINPGEPPPPYVPPPAPPPAPEEEAIDIDIEPEPATDPEPTIDVPADLDELEPRKPTEEQPRPAE